MIFSEIFLVRMGDGGSGIRSVGNATLHVIASNGDMCRRSGFCVYIITAAAPGKFENGPG